MKHIRRGTAVLAGAVIMVTAVGACGAGRTDSSSSSTSSSMVVGTTDKVVSIDPAGSYDNGSTTVQTQVYSYLLNFPEGATMPQPDAAESCDFTKPTVYTCVMKDGLTFANGNPLDAESAAYSFQRIVDIADPNGPASLLINMKSVEAVDNKVVFTLNSANDQTFPQVLATSAGPLVDQEVYPADEVMEDDAAVEAQGFSGPYTIGDYEKNVLAEFQANPDYDGAYNAPETDQVTMKYYTSSDNLKLDIQNGDIDVAWRSLTPTDIASLEDAEGAKVYTGAGGELRYIVFNLKTMPGDNEAQKLAVRKAMAYSIDRTALSETVYKGTFVPAYSILPESVPGATTPFEDMYGSAPDPAAAKQELEKAGVQVPVTLDLQYNTDHYGSSSTEEYNTIRRQLEATDLFDVNLQSTEYTTYSEERVKDSYPLFQLGWFPDFPDADNYLTPFLGPDNFLQSHYEDPAVTKMLDEERTESDEAARTQKLADLQQVVAEQLPILPLLSGAQVAVAGDDVEGVEETLDAAFKFRFTSLSKG